MSDTKGVDVQDNGRVYISEADGAITMSACWEGGITSVEMTPAQANEVIAELQLATASGRRSREGFRVI